MIKPIMKKLLIHTVEYIPFSDDGWTQTESEPKTISNVRIEFVESFVSESIGKVNRGRAKLFWDSYYSTPCTFKNEDKIIFNKHELTVVEVQEFYDDTRLHHLEVVLV